MEIEIVFIIILLMAMFFYIMLDSYFWRKQTRNNNLKELPSLFDKRPPSQFDYEQQTPIYREPKIRAERNPVSQKPILCNKCNGIGELLYNNEGIKYEFPEICDKCEGKGQIIG